MEPATTRISPHEMQMIQGGSSPVRAWTEAKAFRGVGLVSQGIAFDSAIPRRKLDAASSMVQPRAKSFRTPHSQTTAARHPAAASAATWLASRSWFRRSLSSQKEVRVFGKRKKGQPSCLCQKQPCTKITARRLAKTMSGFPGSPLE